jgi:hypothetical protein
MSRTEWTIDVLRSNGSETESHMENTPYQILRARQRLQGLSSAQAVVCLMRHGALKGKEMRS